MSTFSASIRHLLRPSSNTDATYLLPGHCFVHLFQGHVGCPVDAMSVHIVAIVVVCHQEHGHIARRTEVNKLGHRILFEA